MTYIQKITHLQKHASFRQNAVYLGSHPLRILHTAAQQRIQRSLVDNSVKVALAKWEAECIRAMDGIVVETNMSGLHDTDSAGTSVGVTDVRIQTRLAGKLRAHFGCAASHVKHPVDKISR